MIIASWNIRGFHIPLKHLRMQRFFIKKKVDVMAILESKLKRGAFKNIIDWKFQGWNLTSNLNSHHAGRIIILWNNSVDLKVISSTAQLIHCHLLQDLWQNI